MGRFSKEKKKRLHTFGAGFPTPVTKELIDSIAYKVLTPIEKLVLADILRTYFRLTMWDSEPLPAGLTYTWSQCNEIVSERAFQTSMQRICAIGFFEVPPEIQDMRPGAPKRYRASSEWRKYDATVEEKRGLSRYSRWKSERTLAKRKRRSDFRAKLVEEKTARKICADNARKICADSGAKESDCARKIVAD